MTHHALASVALRRPSDDGDPQGRWQPSESTDRIVYWEEKDSGGKVEEDILEAMRMAICRSKAQLTSAFAAAEQARCGASPASKSLKRHVLPYAEWEAVLSSQLPEYAALWPEYGPRLLATIGEAPRRSGQVQFMLWLDRFQIRLLYGREEDFQQSVMGRLYKALQARTREMSLAELLSYFDAKTDGALRQRGVQQALASFDLGLSVRQLRQLVYDLGFTDPKQAVEPVEVLRALLIAVSPAVARGTSEGSIRSAGRSTGRSSLESRPSAVPRSRLRALRAALRKNLPKVREAFAGGALLEVFQRADADTDGFLSYAEACDALLLLQDACGVEVVDRAEMSEVVRHIDISREGRITFLEFVAAIGLPEREGTSRRSQRNSVYDTEADVEEASQIFSVKMMQGILSALYDRSLAMQKAFHHLDEAGQGFLSETDFEQALEVVLAPGDNDVVDGEQLHALVLSLRDSSLTDEAGRIDYPAFIQSFTVVDTLNAM